MRNPCIRILSALLITCTFTTSVLAADSTVLARVGEHDITEKDLNSYIKAIPENYQKLPPKILRPIVLNQMINAELIGKEAQKQNLLNDPLVKQKITLAEEQAVQEVYLTREIKDKITDAAIKEEYNKFLAANPKQEEIKARHMLVDSEEEAKALIEQLDKGENFAKLAKENNKGPEKEKGGDLGWFVKDDMVQEFSEAAFALKKGEYSKTPVKSPFGWHVIKIEDRRTRKQPKFETVKDDLARQYSEKLIQTKMEELRGKANVQIFDDTLDMSKAPAQEKAE